MKATDFSGPEAPVRRVGTFTLGAVLILTGGFLSLSLFFPQLDLRWALQGAPLILISLGVETLLAARSGGKIRYDWLGMLLCFLLTCAALCLYGVAWVLLHRPEWIV